MPDQPHDRENNNEVSADSAKTSDGSLLRRFRAGDEDAATGLYARYAKRLFALARAKTSTELASRMDPEDVVQSVFRTFFRRASQGQYDIPDSDELWNLLLVISLNKIRSLGTHHRAAKRDVSKTASTEKVVEGSDFSSQDDRALHTLQMVVEELLGDISETNRKMIQLRIDGYNVAEIAEETGRSKRSVERVLQSFRQQLHGVINEDPPES